ncbi:MAG: hypothetical protein H6573_27900 [Lewinellaceae bacterium]|nr:hypothetical protein [Lewinellaceae bacterium]
MTWLSYALWNTFQDTWKNMLIVITEDDAQNGVDHIDAHRSILLVISG